MVASRAVAELWWEPGVFPSFCGLFQRMEYILLIRAMASADAEIHSAVQLLRLTDPLSR